MSLNIIKKLLIYALVFVLFGFSSNNAKADGVGVLDQIDAGTKVYSIFNTIITSFIKGWNEGTAENQKNEKIKEEDFKRLKPQFDIYMVNVQRKIKSNWHPPRGSESKSVVCLFRIAKSGELLRYKILKSSKDSLTDNAAINAIKVSTPFEPLLKEYRGNDVDVEFTFDYNVYTQNTAESYIKKLDEEIKTNPDNPKSFADKGNIEFDLKRYNEALYDYNQAIKLDTNNAGLYHNRANTYFLLMKSEESIKDYNEAIRLKPDFWNAYHGRAEVKASLKQYEEAIKDCNEAIKLKPDFWGALCRRGNAKASLKQYNEALKDYDEAIKLNPNNVGLYYNKAKTNYLLMNFDESIKDYDQVIKREPDFVAAYYNRAQAKSALGQKEEAEKDFAKVKELKEKAGQK